MYKYIKVCFGKELNQNRQETFKMASLQNVYTVVIILKFLLVSSSLDETFTNRCNYFGGDVKRVDEVEHCKCSRLQNALQLEMKTTIAPRFENYVKFENIEKLVVKYSGLFKCRNKRLKRNLLFIEITYV